MKKRDSNLKKNVIKFLQNNVLFLSYIVISVLTEVFLRISSVGGHFYFRGLYADIAFVLLMGSFGYLFKPRNRFVYYFILLFFYVGLCVANIIYYQFYTSFISIDLLSTASMIGQVNDSLFAKMRIKHFAFIIFLIIFVLIHLKLKKIKYYEKLENKEETIKYKNIFVPISIIVIVLSAISIYDIGSYAKKWNRENILKRYGMYVYTVTDMIQSIHPKIDNLYGYDESALAFRDYYSCKWEEKDIVNQYTDLFKDKNVLFIHMESIQNFLIDLKINDKEVTPFLNKITKEGIYFNKFYPQISVGTSSDTEFTLQTGLMPSSSGTVFVNYYDRKYYSMVDYFNKLGYYTFSTHANDADYWNRKTMYKTIGYNDFFAKESYIIPEDEDSEELVGLGLSDKEFFKQFIPKLEDIKSNKSKYFGTVITLSNHSPFSDIDSYGEFDTTMNYSYVTAKGNKVSGKAPYLEETTIGNYLKSSHYADSALKELFEALEKNNLLDNTIIVLYGDHEARIPKSDFELLYNYDPIENRLIDKENEEYVSMDNYAYDLLKNTPLIIWSKDTEYSQVISKTMGMYDVLPTISNMFGFKEKYSLGHDIFNDGEGIVVFPNGNVLTDSIYYSNLNEEYISLNNEPISEDYINNIKEYANNILEVSNGIITHNLIETESDKVGKCNKK